jgi:tetrahydromethanopterin:alpha-L-glutamate ligase
LRRVARRVGVTAGCKIIAVAVDDIDWHTRDLLRAFSKLGAYAATVRLSACIFDSTAANGLIIPGFPALPDAMLVRAIEPGSFEQVTRRLGILHALRELGVVMMNDARAIERCVDKSTTTFLIARAGLPTPPSWTVDNIEAARSLAERELGKGALVLKPLFGSQGRGLRLITGPEDLPEPEAVSGVYYLQRFLRFPAEIFLDHRLFVCDGKVIGAMTRRANAWITNITRGGTPEPLVPTGRMIELALAAAAAVGTTYAGVDLLPDETGLSVLEVNSMPGWRGLQEVTEASISEQIAAALCSRL